MFLPDDNTSIDPIDHTSTDPIIRQPRPIGRREILHEKRQRNTDILTDINSAMPAEKNPERRQIAQLRRENKQLRWQLDELQRRIFQLKQAEVDLEEQIATIHKAHQQEIEQYESNLRELIDERNQLQRSNQEWESRFQELYHAFHDSVEEEAHKLVEEAARTLVLSPEHTPALLRDVAKTIELQTKQVEDEHVAGLLCLIRQAQHKAELLEQELADEREKIAAERQNILVQQNNIREQAELRYKTLQQHLQARWTITVAFLASSLVLVLLALQLIFLSLHIPLGISLILPVLICIGLALLFANSRAKANLRNASKNPAPTKTAAKPANSASPAAKKT